ncbi:hypothetical protein N9W17_04620 [Jannaschia sp.]|nr:hypothetical protein [Jannaschia sp.]
MSAIREVLIPIGLAMIGALIVVAIDPTAESWLDEAGKLAGGALGIAAAIIALRAGREDQ